MQIPPKLTPSQSTLLDLRLWSEGSALELSVWCLCAPGFNEYGRLEGGLVAHRLMNSFSIVGFVGPEDLRMLTL